MRVVHLNQDPGIAPGRAKGAAVHVAAMRAALRRIGCEVVELDQPEDGGAALRAVHAERPVDLVYERYALGARAGADFARAEGVPLVIELNAPLLWEEELHRGRPATEEERAVEGEVLGGADRVVAVSRQVADYARAAGAEPGRVLVRPNGFDPEVFHPRDTTALRRRLGIPLDALVVGFHGRLRPWHGFPTVVAAVERALRAGARLHLLVVGAGDWEQHLEAPLVAAASTRVDWLPHAELGDHVASFDVLALGYPADAPCYFSPLKLLEAMASGAVPVVPELGDLPEVVEHGRSGLVYEPGDTAALAAALCGLARDRRQRQRLGCGAIEATRGRTWEELARELVAETVRATAR